MPRRALTYNPGVRLTKASKTEELIAIMAEDEEMAKYKEALEKMSPPCREKCEKIRGMVQAEMQVIFESRYALGVEFLDIYNDETDNGAKVYGKNAIKNICNVLGIDSSLVRACMKFAQLYTPEDVKRLCSQSLARGDLFTWSHLRCLLQIEDDNKREELYQQTVTEGLTCTELAFEVKNLDTKESKRGRPLKVPTTFDGIVAQQRQFAEDWERRYQKVWNNPKYSLASKVEEMTAADVTEERLKATAELAHLLSGVAEQAGSAAAETNRVFKSMELIKLDLDDEAPAAMPTEGETDDVESPKDQEQEKERSEEAKPGKQSGSGLPKK